MFRIIAIVATLLLAVPASATEAGWALLRQGGKVVLLSHAQAPGVGDPANFDIEKCGTQRNLSERGRLQARRIGALFAARAAPIDKILSSRYCRCLDTARQAFGDRLLEPLPALDSIEGKDADPEAQKAEVVDLIHDYSGSGNLILVTHQANITALTGVKPRPGEAVIVAPTENGVAVSGRIIFN
ncbi:histidine phosphatase family protein [Mesorhizobium xinjiangense]|uniref:histidine phosphatase family protein n=1 Tax=Mesorhizobium xinjiangense TaxID=2678685 RepID=UPI0012ED6973|nr:histidine phosphatase family protein [Mesorhizobium xinjiangense]